MKNSWAISAKKSPFSTGYAVYQKTQRTHFDFWTDPPG